MDYGNVIWSEWLRIVPLTVLNLLILLPESYFFLAVLYKNIFFRPPLLPVLKERVTFAYHLWLRCASLKKKNFTPLL
jgi:hypothetical protein